MTGAAAVEAAIADAHRREWARVLAATARVARDLDLAEECVQEAYAAALEAWVSGRHPGQPGRLAHHHGQAARDRRDPPGARRCGPGCPCWWSPKSAEEATVDDVPPDAGTRRAPYRTSGCG